EWTVDGHLVERFDHHVERLPGQPTSVTRHHRKPEGIAAARPVDGDPVDLGLSRSARPPRSQPRDPMAVRPNPPEDLVEVDLGSPRPRILGILPVDQQDVHDRSGSPSLLRLRMMASRTPFTKRGLSGVPYRSASRTASWMATLGGTSST